MISEDIDGNSKDVWLGGDRKYINEVEARFWEVLVIDHCFLDFLNLLICFLLVHQSNLLLFTLLRMYNNKYHIILS